MTRIVIWLPRCRRFGWYVTFTEAQLRNVSMNTVTGRALQQNLNIYNISVHIIHDEGFVKKKTAIDEYW